MMRSTACPSSSMSAPALRASASATPSIVSPGSPRSMPRSPSPTCLISFERAAMMPFSDAYRGSAMPAVTVMSAGVEASTTWYPSAVWRWTLIVVPSSSTFFTIVSCGRPSSSASIGGTIPVLPSYDSVAQMMRSGCSGLIAAASARAVRRTSAPASCSSVMSTPRSSPIDRPLRMASLARSGPIDTRMTSQPWASLSCRPSSIPHSSPGSRTTSRSRATVLSAWRIVVELGSGTCLTVTTIFTRQPLSLRRVSVMESLVVLGCVEAAEQVGIEALQPGHVESFSQICRSQSTGVESRRDSRQRRAPISGTHRLGPTINPRHRGVAATRCSDGPLGQPARYVRHVAGDGEDDLVAGDRQSRLDAGERACGFLAIENQTVWHELLELFGLGERDHHLGERGAQSFHHPAEQVGLPHLEPGLRPAHSAALTPGEHQQGGLHAIYHRPRRESDRFPRSPADTGMAGCVDAGIHRGRRIVFSVQGRAALA